MEGYGFWSVVPPVLSIILALVTKDVFTSLFVGCFSAYTILAGGNFLAGTADTLMSFVKVFASNGNTICIGVTALLGGLLYVIEQSGAIEGFVAMIIGKKALIKSKKGAELFSWFVGIIVFTSGTLSALVTGAVSKPLTDAYKVPHEKLAYIVHSTTSPVCALLPLSAWGAYEIGLIQAQNIPDPATVMVQAIPFNFYAIIAVLMVAFLSITGIDFGPMKKAEMRIRETGLLDAAKAGQTEASEVAAATEKREEISAAYLLVPLFALVVMVLVGLYITGNGELLKGAGMTAILWAITFALFVSGIMLVSQKVMTYKHFIDLVFKGTGNLLPIAFILMFAFSLGAAVKDLGTGKYLAALFSGIITPALLPVLVFIISCIISFATGTSWGTMAVMFPIAIPMAVANGADVVLCVSAILGGSIFGDHASPISDTTIMSSMISGCNIMDHVVTQLPYTLTVATATIAIYMVLGFVM